MLAAALDYALAGLLVLPLHAAPGGVCSCGKPDCDSAGKHPRNSNGLTGASSDVAVVSEWWRRWPDANVGIRTGHESGIVVLDVDPRHGGIGSLETLKRKHGGIPTGPQVLTGSGGQHLYFAFPENGIRNSAGKLGDGLDVRGDGGYVVVPPSRHETGNAYTWLRPFNRETLPDPGELFADAVKRRNGTAAKVADVIPEGQRRAAMLTVAGKLKRSGLTGAEILPTLRELNRRCVPPLDEAELTSVACRSTIEPDPATAIRTVPDADPQPVDDVIETFGRWLHLPDPGSVLVTCAVIAANRIESFDPTWLILVGAAGSGKTEALSATNKLDGVHVVATLTEAALLSGTPRKETAAGASGGLLREIGASGVIVLKDFGSILSMHRDARASVLAALRELFDGSWTRLLGTDGGRRLHWEGRVGLLAGATTVLDQHHAVLAQLGERFLIYRVAIDDASAQGRSSLAHHGRERGMRQELAAAVTGLFAGVDLSTPPPLSPTDTDRLVALAELVARARSPVVRDSYRREIELVPDSEAPGRIIGALARLLTGLRMIGVHESDAWRLTVKTGLDSMPAARRHALELLLAREAPTTTELATALGLPNPTTRRILEDLTAHDVISRESQGPGKADLWRIRPRTVELYSEATSSEMSEDISLNGSDNTFDDFSEEVSE
jgi:hypothetical protein